MKTRRFAVMVTALILAVGLLFLYLAMIRSSASAFVPSLAATAPADIPTVTAVNPDFAPNDLDTPIVITGTGFAVNATVQLDSTELEDVGWVSATRLTATVPWGLDPGVYTLTVTNPGEGSGSRPNAFTVTQGFGVWNTGQLYGGRVSQILVHPVTPTMVYALAQEIGLFRSDDGGGHWSVKVVAPPPYATSLALDPLPPYWLYMGGSMRSEDGGNTWTKMDLPLNAGPSFYPHPLLPGTLYSGNWWSGCCCGLWKSSDYGQTWITITAASGLTDTCVTQVVFHPTDPQTVLANSSSVFYSADGGATWQSLGRGGGRATMAFNSSGTHELWLSAEGTYTSTAPYTAWTQLPGPIGTTDLRSIEFAPPAWGAAYSQTVLVADGGSNFYQTSDGGASWQPFDPAIGPLWDIAVHPTDPNIIYLSGSGNGVYRTTDGGSTWTAVNEGLAAMAPRQLATVPGQPDLVYALFTGWEGIHRGTQGGQQWEFLPVPGADSDGSMAVDPFTPTRLYRSGSAKVLRSDDGGQTWPITGMLDYPALCSDTGSLDPTVLHADPSQPGVLLAGVNGGCRVAADWTEFGAVYRSTDGGQTWTNTLAATSVITECSDVYLEDVAYDTQDPARVYASICCNGLWRSTDSGQSWTRLGQGAPYEWDLIFAQRLAVEPAPPYRVFVNSQVCTSVSGSCMYLSEDHGETWREADDPFHSEPEQLLFAPGDPPVLYAALAGRFGWYHPGLFRTADGGRSWTKAPGELGRVPVYSLAVVTAPDRVILYAGTPGGEVEGASAQLTDAAQQAGAQVAAGTYRYATLEAADLQPGEQVNEDGFGDAANSVVSTLEVLGGQLYAGTWNNSGAQVWRTGEGRNWSQFTPAWPPTKTAVLESQVFGAHLYLGTDDEGGGELWRTDGTTWEQVATGGFGNGNNWGIDVLAVYSDVLYAVAANNDSGPEIWQSATGDTGSWSAFHIPELGGAGASINALEVFDGHLYAGGSKDGLAQLWRTDGVTWTRIFSDGLALGNTHVSAMAGFNGNLYIGLRNVTMGGEVWRSSDGLHWIRVFAGGLGNPDNGRPYGLIVTGDYLYAVLSNTFSGAEVWRTANGNTWRRTNSGGWGDTGNTFADYNDKAATVFRFDLYIGTINDNGGEVWRLPLARRVYLPMVLKGYVP